MLEKSQNFEGDCVLVIRIVFSAVKIVFTMRGPIRIVNAVSDYAFQVEDLCKVFVE